MTFILPLPTVGHGVDNCTKVIWGSRTGNRVRTYSDVAWVKSGNEKATKLCYKTMVLNSNAFRKVYKLVEQLSSCKRKCGETDTCPNMLFIIDRCTCSMFQEHVLIQNTVVRINCNTFS